MDMDDQSAVSAAFERSKAQMRLTLNRIKARVVSATGGAVEMNARTEDPSCYWHTFVRLCSSSSEQVRNELILWRINKNDIETGELFCAFGMPQVATQCLASFNVNLRLTACPRVPNSGAA